MSAMFQVCSFEQVMRSLGNGNRVDQRAREDAAALDEIAIANRMRLLKESREEAEAALRRQMPKRDEVADVTTATAHDRESGYSNGSQAGRAPRVGVSVREEWEPYRRIYGLATAIAKAAGFSYETMKNIARGEPVSWKTAQEFRSVLESIRREGFKIGDRVIKIDDFKGGKWTPGRPVVKGGKSGKGRVGGPLADAAACAALLARMRPALNCYGVRAGVANASGIAEGSMRQFEEGKPIRQITYEAIVRGFAEVVANGYSVRGAIKKLPRALIIEEEVAA